MSMATLFVWIGTTFVGQMTPWLLDNLQTYGTFWFFALCTLPAYLIILKFMPETMRKTLEKIKRHWLDQ